MVVIVATMITTALLGLGTTTATAAPATSKTATSKVAVVGADAPVFVDSYTWANWALNAYRSSAPTISVIADTPQARWFGEWTPAATVAAQVSSYVSGAAAARRMPLLTLYAIPHRDCGGYSAGGLSSPQAYAAWIAQVRRGIAHRPAMIVLEPDALTSADCLSKADRSARYAMLKQAVTTLSADHGSRVYIDGGHSRWLSAQALASRLRSVGVSRARGFSLNVGNFYTTKEEISYGERVAQLVGGKHYVVDTSRNGLGPAPAIGQNWCNPAGRALGSKPTRKTSGKYADAYLWIKHPGESDGSCQRNDPTSGTWFNSYAVGLVQRSVYHR